MAINIAGSLLSEYSVASNVEVPLVSGSNTSDNIYNLYLIRRVNFFFRFVPLCNTMILSDTIIYRKRFHCIFVVLYIYSVLLFRVFFYIHLVQIQLKNLNFLHQIYMT